MNDRGSATLLVPVLVAATVMLLAAIVGGGMVATARARAQTAADAAALAAAPLTFLGADPRAEADRYAAAHGATLTSCSCESDPTFAPRETTVAVEVSVHLPILGEVTIPASATAEFRPLALLGH